MYCVRSPVTVWVTEAVQVGSEIVGLSNEILCSEESQEGLALLDLCGYPEQLSLSDSVAACLFRLIQNPGGRP